MGFSCNLCQKETFEMNNEFNLLNNLEHPEGQPMNDFEGADAAHKQGYGGDGMGQKNQF